MKAKLEVELKPFQVPNFVIADRPARTREEGVVFESAIPLSDISAETLEKLCDKFTDAVFAKAGKQRPPIHCPA